MPTPRTPNPARAADHGGRTLGPSDSSDSAADMLGIPGDDDTDRNGTGERMDVESISAERASSDVKPDRVVRAEEAGLGDGLDQAEEAQLGTTDEELEELLGTGEEE